MIGRTVLALQAYNSDLVICMVEGHKIGGPVVIKGGTRKEECFASMRVKIEMAMFSLVPEVQPNVLFVL